MPDLYAIILAGGASSRFWPLSGDSHPKYLLKPDGDSTLIESAWQRATLCAEPARVLVVTAAAQAADVRNVLPALPPANLCVEPARRDTAAAIALGCKRVAALDGNADVLVLPADTLLNPPESLREGVAAARAQPGYRDAIHLFGVPPTRAEGGFGYIEPAAVIGGGVSAVRGFTEKPGDERAAELAQQGCLWNIGCFLFSLRAFDQAMAAYLPQHSVRLRPALPGAPSPGDYEQLPAISIDFGMIEKEQNLRVARLASEFDDIGNWDALMQRLERSGRSLQQAISIGGKGNFASGEGATVAVVGESNLLVVVSDGKVLVLKRGHGQDVKKIGPLP